jgi:hypothetical protein
MARVMLGLPGAITCQRIQGRDIADFMFESPMRRAVSISVNPNEPLARLDHHSPPYMPTQVSM